MELDAGALNRKIGPLPVWAWAALGSVTLIILFRIRANREATATPTADPNSDDVVEPEDNTVGDGGSDNGTISPPPQPAPGGRARTNEEWMVQATDVLIGMGHEPLEVQRALGDYLSGVALDFAQQRLVRIAINTIGSPPEPPPVVNTPATPPTWQPSPLPGITRPLPTAPAPTAPKPAPAPTPVPAPKPTAPKVYVVQSGDTLSSIAAKFRITWQKLYQANVTVIGPNPNLIRPGQRLVIP